MVERPGSNMTRILEGTPIREQIADKLSGEIDQLDPKPKLAIIQIGDSPDSNTYIRQKARFGKQIGAIVDHQKFSNDIGQQQLIDHILRFNADNSVHGIIVQIPIPDHLDEHQVIDAISPIKDVDGQTSVNIKLLFEGSARNTPGVKSRSHQENTPGVNSGFVPATTKGILTLLDYYKIPVEGKNVVIVGRSTLVGKPTMHAFLNHDATVTICHSKTRNLASITKTADILVVATGKPKLITKDYVSPNQVVVDVGINVVAEHHSRSELSSSTQTHSGSVEKPETEPYGRKLVGDVDFESVSKIVKAITPVPGGIGPMTVASLFQNLLGAYQRQLS